MDARIPTIKNLTIDTLIKTIRLILNREYSSCFNLILANTANFLNFYLNGHSFKVECPCCKWKGPAFIALSNWRQITYQSKCPACDSRSRHRGLITILPAIIKSTPPGKMLVFAPEKIILDFIMQQLPQGSVCTTDLNRLDVDLPHEDIQKLSFRDNSFSMVVCNHVLEHVKDDEAAVKECARILRPGGISVFTIPGDFEKETTWYFDRPDSNGHFRHYGKDIINKFKARFREVHVIDMGEKSKPEHEIRRFDLAFLCYK